MLNLGRSTLAVLATATAVFAVAGPAHAAPSPAYAFLTGGNYSSSQPTEILETVNSTGAANSLTRLGTGRYLVHLPGVARDDGGTVSVTPVIRDTYGDCSVEDWSAAGTDVDVTIACFTTFSRNPLDTSFAMTYGDPDGAVDGDFAYARSTDAVAARTDIAPSEPYAANSRSPKTTKIRRTGVGRYSVTFPGDWPPGVAKVSAVDDAPGFCQVLTAEPLASGTGAVVQVRCFVGFYSRQAPSLSDQAPADRRFVVQYTSTQNLTGVAGTNQWGWIRGSRTARPCAEPDALSFNSTGGINSFCYGGARFGGLQTSAPTNAQAGSYKSLGVRCVTRLSTTWPTYEEVGIVCSGPNAGARRATVFLQEDPGA